MKFNFTDPTFLIPVGIILVGAVLLAWAIGKLLKKTPQPDETLLDDAALPATTDEFYDAVPAPEEFQSPPAESRPSPSASGGGKEKELTERLDTMSHRLADMQAVLQRQATSVPAGTPLTPDTIDKLLKIIANVTQQVDILQRSLGAPAPTPVLNSTPTPIPTRAPTPTPKPMVPEPVASPRANPPPPTTSASAPSGSAPAPVPGTVPSSGDKGIGVAGGALSSLPKPPPQTTSSPAKPGLSGAVTPPPPATPPK